MGDPRRRRIRRPAFSGCAFGNCRAFIVGGRTARACWICYLHTKPLGWHPGDSRKTERALRSVRGTV